MAVKIRLKRIGRKKQPTYRIVVIESRNPRGGKVIESIGHYSPYLQDKTLVIDLDQVQKWRDKGAIPSDAVKRLLRRARREAEKPEGVAIVTKTPDIDAGIGESAESIGEEEPAGESAEADATDENQ